MYKNRFRDIVIDDPEKANAYSVKIQYTGR